MIETGKDKSPFPIHTEISKTQASFIYIPTEFEAPSGYLLQRFHGFQE